MNNKQNTYTTDNLSKSPSDSSRELIELLVKEKDPTLKNLTLGKLQVNIDDIKHNVYKIQINNETKTFDLMTVGAYNPWYLSQALLSYNKIVNAESLFVKVTGSHDGGIFKQRIIEEMEGGGYVFEPSEKVFKLAGFKMADDLSVNKMSLSKSYKQIMSLSAKVLHSNKYDYAALERLLLFIQNSAPNPVSRSVVAFFAASMLYTELQSERLAGVMDSSSLAIIDKAENLVLNTVFNDISSLSNPALIFSDFLKISTTLTSSGNLYEARDDISIVARHTTGLHIGAYLSIIAREESIHAYYAPCFDLYIRIYTSDNPYSKRFVFVISRLMPRPLLGCSYMGNMQYYSFTLGFLFTNLLKLPPYLETSLVTLIHNKGTVTLVGTHINVMRNLFCSFFSHIEAVSKYVAITDSNLYSFLNDRFNNTDANEVDVIRRYLPSMSNLTNEDFDDVPF